MKHFSDKLDSYRKKLSELEAIQKQIEALPYKVKEPVIYESNMALVRGFKTAYGPNNEIVLTVSIYYVSDELTDKDKTLLYRMVEADVSPDKLAPYTDTAKLLFTKG